MISPTVSAHADIAPPHALAFGNLGDPAQLVSANRPLPVQPQTLPGTSTPVQGTASTSAILGPFLPQLGREIVLTLSGTWVGSVALTRSAHDGPQLPATLSGRALIWTSALNEIVWLETEAGVALYLDFVRTSGSLVYRIAQ